MTVIYRLPVCWFILANTAFGQADDLNQLLQQGQESLANGHYFDAE
jgi:hypothetical protein